MRTLHRLAALSFLLAFASPAVAAPGDLDTSFGSAGLVTTTVGANTEIHAAVLQGDGAIVVAGKSDGDFALLRYLGNGSLDPGFGSGGIVTTSIGDDAVANALALQTDGKLVAAGVSTSAGSPAVTVVRYNDDGSLDSGFGSSGIATVPLPTATAGGVALQADGKIVVAGSTDVAGSGGFALLRFNDDGTPDAGFGSGGVEVVANGGTLNAVIVQPDQQILVCGGASNQFAVARYDGSGAPDPLFGSGGISLQGSFGAPCSAFHRMSDGRITGIANTSTNGVWIRLLADGSLDSSLVSNLPPPYTTPGVRAWALNYCSASARPAALAVDSFGRTLMTGYRDEAYCYIAGSIPHRVQTSSGFLGQRFSMDGTTDDFQQPGPSPEVADFRDAETLLLQPDTRMVAVGWAAPNRVTIARYRTATCGDGVVEDDECEDGNAVNGDGCDNNCTPTGCGNGIATMGEACDSPDCCTASCTLETAGTPCSDDGNVCTDNVCDAAGACLHPDNTAPCNDGNACTESDTCSSGACAGAPTNACPTCLVCQPADGSCAVEVQEDCAVPDNRDASLRIRNKSLVERDDIRFKWNHATTTVDQFGDPTATDDFSVCIYDETLAYAPELIFSASMPAGLSCGTRACWTKTGSKGFRYKNKSGDPDGVSQMSLKAGTGNGKFLFQAKGANLYGRPGELPALPLPVPIRIQMVSGNGNCWEDLYDTPFSNAPDYYYAETFP